MPTVPATLGEELLYNPFLRVVWGLCPGPPGGQARSIWQGPSHYVSGGPVLSPGAALQSRLTQGQSTVRGASLAIVWTRREVSRDRLLLG